jgi:hypothetical protein
LLITYNFGKRLGSLRNCLLLFLVAGPAAANDLTSLRATLGTLQGRSPLSGSAEFELNTRIRDSGDVQNENGRIAFGWSWSNGQLSLSFPQALLDRAEQEQRARRIDPDRPAPIRTALLSLSALQISDAIDFGRTLSRELERAEIVRSQGDLLELKLPPRLGRTEQKHVRDSETRLRIWRGIDGVPVRAERTIRIRARFFFISFETNRTDRWTLARRADRLIATRHEEEESTSIIGRSSQSRTITTITID